MGARRNPIGTRLGTHKDKTATRMAHRAKDKRVQTSLEKARAQQAALDARIAAEKLAEPPAPVRQPVPTPVVATTSPAPAPAPAPTPASWAEQIGRAGRDRWRKGEKGWSLAEARQQINDGYTLAKVVQRTGWGEGWFEDLDVRLA